MVTCWLEENIYTTSYAETTRNNLVHFEAKLWKFHHTKHWKTKMFLLEGVEEASFQTTTLEAIKHHDDHYLLKTEMNVTRYKS